MSDMVVDKRHETEMFPPITGTGAPEYWMFPLIWGIGEKSRRWCEKQLKQLGMTFPQYVALAALSAWDGASQRELAGVMDIDTTTMTVVCDSLEKKKLIERRHDPTDRRVNRLFLTEAGKQAYAGAFPQIQEGAGRVLAGIPPDRLEETLHLLWELYDNANDLHDSA